MANGLVPLVVAPFIGSFLGVIIRRLPRGRPIGMARSACEACGHVLRWSDMIPIVSYVRLRGRCRSCGAPIGRFHWAVEAAALGVALWVVAVEPVPALVWPDCGLAWTLLAVAWIDWDHRRLPDALTLPLLLAGLTVTAIVAPWRLESHAIGAVVGYAGFRLLAWGYARLRGREGLGQGDAKLLGCAGAWVGWADLNQVVLLGALLSIGLALWRGRGQRLSGSTAVPFGPGLALATLIIRLHG